MSQEKRAPSIGGGRHRIGLAISTKDRTELTAQVLPGLDCGGFDLIWCDGSLTAEGKALPSARHFQHTPLKEISFGISGGPDAAIQFSLKRLLALGYDYVGLIENDILLKPGWLQAMVAAWQAAQRDGLNVGAATARSIASRVLAGASEYVVKWNMGAGMVLFSRAAAEAVLADYQLTSARQIQEFYQTRLGVDLSPVWELFMDQQNRGLGADWHYAPSLFKHGLLAIGVVPNLAQNIDVDLEEVCRTRYLRSAQEPLPSHCVTLIHLKTTLNAKDGLAVSSHPSKPRVAADLCHEKDLTSVQKNSEFEQSLRRLIRTTRPRFIIETGTYLGTGTTRIISAALQESGLNETKFYSVECNAEHQRQAQANLRCADLLQHVCLLHGLSIPRTLLPGPETIRRQTIEDVDGAVFVDHQEDQRVARYLQETDFPDIPDNMLASCLRECDGRPDLVLLDSGGHMGNLEFNHLLNLLQGACYIALDDIRHVKHVHSMEQMQADPRFEILFVTNEKFGSCIARFTPRPSVKQAGEFERILFVRTDSIGDAVLASSMLEPIRRRYPLAQLAVLCQQHVAELFAACPWVDSVICYETSRTSTEAGRKEILDEIAAFNPDVILNSVRSRDALSDALTLGFREARHIAIECDLDNISEADRAKSRGQYELLLPGSDTVRNELARHSAFLRELGIDAPPLQPQVWTTSADEQVADAFFQQHELDPLRTMAVFPFTQHGIKDYPGFAEALASFQNWNFLLLGGNDAQAGCDSLARQLPGRAINLAGRATLRETAALLRRCRILVGSDTCGPHMACAVGVPNVVVLGGGHFGRFMPYSPLSSAVALPVDCYGCNWRCPYSHAHCVKDVSARVVAEAIRQTLEESSAKPRLFIQSPAAWHADQNRPKWQRPDRFLDGVEIITVDSEIPPSATSSHRLEEKQVVATPKAVKPSEGRKQPSGGEPAGTRGRVLPHVPSQAQREDEHSAVTLPVPDLALGFLDIAGQYFARGDLKSCRGSLQRALEVAPDHPDILAASASILFQLGELAAARSRFQASLARRPNPRVFTQLALTCLRLDDMTSFEQAVTRAFELDPQCLEAHRLLGDLNLQTNRYADAARHYGHVINRIPNDPILLRALGKCFAELQQPDAARACVERARQLEAMPSLPNESSTAHSSAVAQSSTWTPAASCGSETASCPVCQTAAPSVLRKRGQTYHCCPECGIVFTPRIDPAMLQTENSGNNARHDQSQDAVRLDRLARALGGRPQRLVDFGCGKGESLHYFQAQGIDAIGIDQNTSAQLGDLWDESVDGITMIEVVEHLYDPHTVFQQFNRILKRGGVVYLESSFTDGKDLAYWDYLDPAIGHCTVHSTRSIEQVARRNGFSLAWLNANVACLTKQSTMRSADVASPPQQVEVVGEGIADPLVTIAVSTYQSERFLRPCLENLTRQTIFDCCEVIVVDSGSPENERAITTEFQSRYKNIRYVRTPNETLYAAWNRALELARGRYFVNANTDDAMRDDALEVLVEALDANPAARLAYADCVWTSKPNDRFPSAHVLQEVRYPDYEPVHTLFYCITGCLQFWRTGALRGLGGFDPSFRCAGDYEMTLRLALAGGSAVHVPDFLSLFYQNREGLTQASTTADEEHERVSNRHRATLPIDRIYACRPGNALDAARAWTALGVYANDIYVPWEPQRFKQEGFAFDCFRKAFELESECSEGCFNYLLALERTGQGHRLREFTDSPSMVMQSALARLCQSKTYELPNVQPAVAGPVFDSAQVHPEILAAEPLAVRPWVSRRDGRFTYLSRNLIPRPLGQRYTPKELEKLGIQIFKALAEFPRFHAHFGGAGDALLLLSSFYDKQPRDIIISYPNSVPAARALFETFPGGQVYLLPLSDDPHIHAVLRWIVRSLPNCIGAGATPKGGYDEWKPGMDIEKAYAINKSPRWARAFRQNEDLRRVALAPKGSLTGMVGSKRNCIDPRIWPDLIRHVQSEGFEVVLLGTPDEDREYPTLDGCINKRSRSFRDQMEEIGKCAVFVGADSWGKTFSALAGIPTIVFEPLKGPDWAGKKDASDFVFVDPWPAITMVKSFAEFSERFARVTRKTAPLPGPQAAPAASASADGTPVTVAWQGSYLDFGSLSHVNRELTSQFAQQPRLRLTRVSGELLRNGSTKLPELQRISRSLSPQPPREAQITVRHAWPPNWKRPANGKLVVIQPWEFGALPEQWVKDSANVDEFWVPSEYVRRVYVESGVPANKVVVVPNGVDSQKFHPQAAPMKLATGKKFKFLFVGGTIFRKGPDVLLTAYLETFTATDDVSLVIKDFGGQSVYAGQTLESEIRAAQTRPNAPEILHLTDELPPEALPGLYTACNCLVHPYRGEGFGLPVLEAMACGLPVIVTSGGAADDFATPDLVYPVSARRRAIGREISGMKLAGEGWLLEPCVEETAAQMRRVFTHPDEARAKGRAAGECIRRDWTWKRAAEIARQRLEKLQAETQAAATASTNSKVKRSSPITLPRTALSEHVGKARELLGRRRLREAWEATSTAIHTRPYHPEAYLLLAEIALAAGDAVSARRCAQHAREIAPAWKPAARFLKGNLRGNSRPDWLVLPEAIRNPKSEVRNRLSVCLIARNEEKFLGQCLASVRGLADQIVVVDTGSTDRTIGIAKEHGAEVHSFAWCDDFSAARNAALEHATGDWILMLDADEELPPESHEPLRRLMGAKNVMAWRLPILDVGREDEGRSFVPRLFRNAAALFYVGRVHEQVFSSIEVRRQEWGLENKLGDAALRHHGYRPDVVKDRNKIERNLRLLEKAVEELPGEPNLLMNYGLELVRSGQLAAGVQQYRNAFEAMSEQLPELIVPEAREMLLMQFCTQLMALKRFEEMVRVLTSPLAKAGGLTASLHFSLGLAHLELKQFREAADQMRQCLAKRDQPSLAPINKEIHKAGPQHCLALCLDQLGETEAADDAFRKAIETDPASLSARFDYARFLAAHRQSVEALNLLFALASERPDDARVWIEGGRIALGQPDFLEVALDWTAEAYRHAPQNPVIARQRAEALMLAGQCDAALAVWRQLQNGDPSANAAVVLCETALGENQFMPAPDAEVGISREFVKWYQRLLQFNARAMVEDLNGRVESLEQVLPSAAQLLRAVLAEVEPEAASAATVA